VDGSGSAYVSGYTKSTDFPTTPGAFDTSFNGGIFDAFVTKVNAAGSALVYSTFLGGSGKDYGNGIAVDGVGSVYAVGTTRSTNFPTTPGAFQTTYAGGDNYSGGDAYVTKVCARRCQALVSRIGEADVQGEDVLVVEVALVTQGKGGLVAVPAPVVRLEPALEYSLFAARWSGGMAE